MLCGVEAGVVVADVALARVTVTEAEPHRWLDRLVRHPSVRAARLAVDLADRRRVRRISEMRWCGVTWAELDRPVLLRQRLLAALARAARG